MPWAFASPLAYHSYPPEGRALTVVYDDNGNRLPKWDSWVVVPESVAYAIFILRRPFPGILLPLRPPSATAEETTSVAAGLRALDFDILDELYLAMGPTALVGPIRLLVPPA